jgi:hypothetical protein
MVSMMHQYERRANSGDVADCAVRLKPREQPTIEWLVYSLPSANVFRSGRSVSYQATITP